MSITVARTDLLQSLPALMAIGAVKLPVSKDQYWLTKTHKKCVAALNKESKAAQRKMNEMIGDLGEPRKDEQGNETPVKWIPPTNMEASKKFEDMRDEYLAESVSLDVDRLPMSKLEAAGVELSVEHQGILEWLIDSEKMA